MNFITVCRDIELYEKFFNQNPLVSCFKLFLLDNRQENLGIPTRYNQFISDYDFSVDSWLIFCHEDFLLKDTNFEEKLNNLPKDAIYGPIGSKLILDKLSISFNRKNHKFPFKDLIGSITQCEKDGSDRKQVGNTLSSFSSVDTVDCCCLIVHSSLIQRFQLRFDENLSFDLYAEDFCMNAKEKHGIKSFAVQFDCEHWSSGNITERYFKGLNYLNHKFPSALYAGTCSFVGGKSIELGKKTNDLIPYLVIYNALGLTSLVNLAIKLNQYLPERIRKIFKKLFLGE